ncbi:hypothetical protein AM587_10013845 [Phytophthora nicotianae]|uniref:Uncharacterized protein n=1 Tax=Phytophthora nicotianae TaxID=4792 RepID=A0A0W8D348_PHYNI|nr:hypothetical protein AM587_10014497 [Phytophthora nicotianae]KUF90825.1 hypothetical protein AM587_10013845 [Phytophthora nicotianae]
MKKLVNYKAPGVLGMLTVVPPEQIAVQRISWVKRQIKDRCRRNRVAYARSSWRCFWRYFAHTWLKLYDPELLNVHGLTNKLVARTNNPLTRSHVAVLAAVRGRRARGRTRETIHLTQPVDLLIEAEDSTVDEYNVEEGQSDSSSEVPRSDSDDSSTGKEREVCGVV